MVYKDICPSGILKVDYDFCREDPFISMFSPMGRVLEIEREKDFCRQKMVIDPVYFDVRLPQSFRTAKLKVWYKKDKDVLFKIGPRFNSNEWKWLLRDVEYIGNEGEWQIGIIEYNLSYIQIDNNRLRFLISSPGLDESGNEILFKKIEIEFEKEQLGFGNLLRRIKSLLEIRL